MAMWGERNCFNRDATAPYVSPFDIYMTGTSRGGVPGAWSTADVLLSAKRSSKPRKCRLISSRKTNLWLRLLLHAARRRRTSNECRAPSSSIKKLSESDSRNADENHQLRSIIRRTELTRDDCVLVKFEEEQCASY